MKRVTFRDVCRTGESFGEVSREQSLLDACRADGPFSKSTPEREKDRDDQRSLLCVILMSPMTGVLRIAFFSNCIFQITFSSLL